MKNVLQITPTLQETAHKVDATEEQIRDAPMLFNCTFDFAYENGGPLTRTFIEKVDKEVPSGGAVLDTRSHMLMPGQYPCIPGWHLDSIPRCPETGQPNLFTKREHPCCHYLCVCGPTAMTEFVAGSINIEGVDDTRVYGSLNDILAEMRPLSRKVKSGIIYRFGDSDIHRGTVAEERCWRWFARASFNDGRTPRNEIRKQVQVYADPNGGW